MRMIHRNVREFVYASLPGTKAEIAARAGVSDSAVSRWVNRMHNAREVYISDWRKHVGGGPDVPVYSVGNEPDAANRLKKLTKKQIQKRYIAKAREDGRYDKVMARDRSRYWKDRATKQGDPLVSALFGRPSERMKEAA